MNTDNQIETEIIKKGKHLSIILCNIQDNIVGTNKRHSLLRRSDCQISSKICKNKDKHAVLSPIRGRTQQNAVH